MTVDKTLDNRWEVITSDSASIVAKDNILYAISDSSTVAPTTTTGVPLSGGDMVQIDSGQVLWTLLIHKHQNLLILSLKNQLSDRKSTRLNSSHSAKSRMPSSA